MATRFSTGYDAAARWLAARAQSGDGESDADYKVYFVEQESREHNKQLISPGRLVARASDADVKVFIVDQEHQSTIKVMHQHFPH